MYFWQIRERNCGILEKFGREIVGSWKNSVECFWQNSFWSLLIYTYIVSPMRLNEVLLSELLIFKVNTKAAAPSKCLILLPRNLIKCQDCCDKAVLQIGSVRSNHLFLVLIARYVNIMRWVVWLIHMFGNIGLPHYSWCFVPTMNKPINGSRF